MRYQQTITENICSGPFDHCVALRVEGRIIKISVLKCNLEIEKEKNNFVRKNDLAAAITTFTALLMPTPI